MMMPSGHGEGGDASKCPFAMMMKAMESNPGLKDKFKKEAEEFDTDTDEDDEENTDEYYRKGAEAYDKARAEREAEAESRRARMMAAMSEAMNNGGGAGPPVSLACYLPQLKN